MRKIFLIVFVLGLMVGNIFGQEENNKILFVLSSHAEKGDTGEKTGYYLSEASHPWKVLTEKGFEVVFASPKGGNPPVDGFDLEDPVNKEFWNNEKVKAKLKNTIKLEDVDPSDYAAVHFVGGHGTMWDFPENENIKDIAANIYEKGGVVTAVCHGPAALVNVKLSDGSYLIDGKKIAAFTNNEESAVGLTEVVPFLLEDKLKERGAEFKEAKNWSKNVQVDGRLITGQNPASAEKLAEELVKKLRKEK